MKRLSIMVGSALLALSCTPEHVEASPGRPEDVVSQLEQSAAALQLMAGSLAALEGRQAELRMRMGSLFDQLPDRHAGLEAVAHEVGELGPLQATWSQQLEALARASEPNWALVNSGDAAEAALGRAPVILDAPEVDIGLRAREARVLEKIGEVVWALRQDVQRFYDVLGDLPVVTATSDKAAVQSLQEALSAYLTHLQALSSELLHADGVLRHLQAMRYDLRVGLPEAWKSQILALLSRHVAVEAGRSQDNIAGIQVALQTQGAVETRVRQWENQFTGLLGLYCPSLALRHARGWQTLAREASKRTALGRLPDNFKTHLVAVLEDSADEAERRIEQAQQLIDARYGRYRRARLRALEQQVGRSREPLTGRCLELANVARADEGVAGEESFQSFMEGCR
jgi:hypothetical protein